VSAATARPGAATRAIAASLLLASTLIGCATVPTDPIERAAFEQTNDPLEPLNREILDANLVLDKVLLRPAAKVYVAVVPEEGREAVRRMLDNLKEPVLVINNVLQGEVDRAGTSVGRFAVNSTLGIGGMLDVATKFGLERQPADFGQTLFIWGMPEGPYLILPVLGPSNPRDAIGMAADAYMDPFSFLATAKSLDELQISRFVIDGIDQRARVIDVLDDLERNSLDFYAQLRSLTQQRRAAELRRGAAPETAPNFYNDPGKPEPTPSEPAGPAPKPAPFQPAPAAATRKPGAGPRISVAGPIARKTAPDEGPLRGSPRP